MYAFGRGVVQDYVQAHKWRNLAASRQTGVDRMISTDRRDALASFMTPPPRWASVTSSLASGTPRTRVSRIDLPANLAGAHRALTMKVRLLRVGRSTFFALFAVSVGDILEASCLLVVTPEFYRSGWNDLRGAGQAATSLRAVGPRSSCRGTCLRSPRRRRGCGPCPWRCRHWG